MDEAPDISKHPKASVQGVSAPKPAGGNSLKLVAVIGAAVAIGAAILGTNLRTTHTGSEIAIVPKGEISAAASTLAGQSATGIVDEAKSCKTPMAIITVSKQTGAQPGVIRIRSGAYLSPPFSLAEAPQRIAIPFPTAYATGLGTITVEGEASNAVVSLYPAVNIDKLAGTTPITIWWIPKDPC